jgi:hypothetical protein
MAKEPAKTTKMTVASAAAGRSHRCQEAGSAPSLNRRIRPSQKAPAAFLASCNWCGAEMRRTPGEAGSAMAQLGGPWRSARI